MLHILSQCFFVAAFLEVQYRLCYNVLRPVTKQYILTIYVKAEFCV
jgi:hypothetical protein